MFQSDDYRSTRFRDFIDHGPKVRRAVLELFEHISFMFYSWLTLHAFDQNKLFHMVSEDDEIVQRR